LFTRTTPDYAINKTSRRTFQAIQEEIIDPLTGKIGADLHQFHPSLL
jgi:hypothetical protein